MDNHNVRMNDLQS